MLLVAWQATNIMAHTVDIKVRFERYNMVPGPSCRTFRRNLMHHGGKSDARGYSLWDTLVREDEGAVAPGTGIFGVAPVPQPGAPVIAGAGGVEGTRLHRARVKDAAVFLVQHIDDDASKAIIEQFGQNGPEIFDYVMANCLVPLSTDDLYELKSKITTISIKHSVGSQETTVRDLLKVIRADVLLMAPATMSDDEIAEIILRAIGKASAHLSESAMDEVNAPPGPIGMMGSRKYQRAPTPAAVAAAAAAGLPAPLNTRDLMGIVQAFDEKWKAAVRAGRIPKQAPVALPAASAGASLEIGRSLTVVERGYRTHVGALDMNSHVVYGREGREVAMDELHARRVANELPSSATELGHMAGLDVERGTVSTTDWSVTTPSELARAVECEECDEPGEGPGYCVVVGRDADRTPIMEMLCDCCGGAGHLQRVCPSAKKHRSHSYMIELHTSAKERKDGRGQRGGKRATVRGQKPPLQPRTFSPNARTSRVGQPRRYFPSRSAEEFEGEEDPAETVTSRSAALSAAEPQPPPPAEQKPQPSQEPAEVTTPGAASFAGCQSFFARMDERGRPAEAGEKGQTVVGRTATAGTLEPGPAPARQKRVPIFLGAIGLVLLVAGAMLLGAALADGDANSVMLTVGGAAAALKPRAALRRLQETVAAVAEVSPIGMALTMLLCFAIGRVAGMAATPSVGLPTHLSHAIDMGSLVTGPGHIFDELIDARNSTLGRSPHVVQKEGGPESDILACDDSGASGLIFPMTDIHLCDQITDESPNVGVEVADGFRLKAGKVGDINSSIETLTLVCDSFRVLPDGSELERSGSRRCAIDTIRTARDRVASREKRKSTMRH